MELGSVAENELWHSTQAGVYAVWQRGLFSRGGCAKIEAEEGFALLLGLFVLRSWCKTVQVGETVVRKIIQEGMGGRVWKCPRCQMRM